MPNTGQLETQPVVPAAEMRSFENPAARLDRPPRYAPLPAELRAAAGDGSPLLIAPPRRALFGSVGGLWAAVFLSAAAARGAAFYLMCFVWVYLVYGVYGLSLVWRRCGYRRFFLWLGTALSALAGAGAGAVAVRTAVWLGVIFGGAG